MNQIKTKFKDFNIYDKENCNEATNLINIIKNGRFGNGYDNWKFPKDKGIWHITTYYAPGIKENIRQQNRAYKEFSEGKLYKIKFDGLVYIPGNLIFAYTNSDSFYSNNDVSHLTLLVKGYLKPKHSNSALNELFNNKKNNSNENLYYKEIKIDGYNYGAYVLKFNNSPELEALSPLVWIPTTL